MVVKHPIPPHGTGITAGAFDLCHTGHLLFFEECKNQSERLIVCLHTNPQIDRPEKNVPCETTYERWVRLKSCKYVDEIIPYDTERDLLNILKSTFWTKRFLDHTYRDKVYTGHDFYAAYHIFIPRIHDHSTTSLRERIKNG